MTEANILVAGIGNIFLGDDAFGVEVVKRLAGHPLPPGVKVADFGIRGLDLAFEMLDRADGTAILVDATPRGGEAGTVYLIEAEMPAAGDAASGWADAHSMTPGVVLALLARLGGVAPRVLVVGCEPLRAEEEMGLSPPVERAVDEAVSLILEVIARETGQNASGKGTS
jgi:hydrogenase maturation protease